MVEKDPSLMGSIGIPESIEELEKLKSDIVEQLRAADVKFPIRDKADLASIYPRGTQKSCYYMGKKVSIPELIPNIDDRVFPLENAGDAATALVSSCQLNVEK
jgi:hypothetical protein